MEARAQLDPVLRPLQVGSLALGCIIGFGCFILAGDFLATAGPVGASLGVLLGGLAMLVIARSYSVMVRMFPVAGAEFAYAYRVGGRHHAFVCGWFLTLGYLSIVPLNATALIILARFVAPGIFARGYLYSVAGYDVFAAEVALATLAVVIMGFLQYRGVRDVGRTQVVMTGLLIAAVIIIGSGAFAGPEASPANWKPHFTPDRPALAGILAIVAISPWLYVGFDTLPQAAEEFAFPPRRALQLMALAILAGAAMYVAVILATGLVAPWRELVEGGHLWPTGVTVAASLGKWGTGFLSIAVVTAIFTGINGFFLASSRLLFSMGRARILPPWFGSVHRSHGTPHHAILFTGITSLMAPWFGREVILWVVDMAALGTAIGYLYTCVAALSTARRSGDVWVGRLIEQLSAGLGAVLSLGFVLLLCVPGMPGFMAGPSWAALAGWVLLGAAFYIARIREFSAIPAQEMDGLVLGDRAGAG